MSTVATTEPKPPAIEKIKVKVDGREVEVPRLTPDWSGKLAPTTMIQACDAARTDVPHYCYHPKLPISGNCRMCLVEFGTPALGPDRKPLQGSRDQVLADLAAFRDLGVESMLLETRYRSLDDMIAIYESFATDIRPQI